MLAGYLQEMHTPDAQRRAEPQPVPTFDLATVQKAA